MSTKTKIQPYVNWLQRFTIYETLDDICIVASDATEKYFRVMRISRMLANNQTQILEPTLSSETDYDKAWRLNIKTDCRIYTRKELASFLQSIKAKCPVTQPAVFIASDSSSNKATSLSDRGSSLPFSVGSCHPLTKSLTGVGLIGFIRFLSGYYLIVVTQRREVARIGEHRIYKIEETKTLYIPQDMTTLSSDDSFNGKNTSLPTANHSEESRYLKMFGSLELNRHVYFSYTYDLTKSLQANMAPLEISGKCPHAANSTIIFRSVPDARFLWNFSLIPPRFQPIPGNVSDWFVNLVHGFVKQDFVVSCGMPISITLLARRSRYFAGTRFLKRGTNIDGNVANEVETEQIVCNGSEPTLSRMRVSSMVQYRGSVPLFWSQDTTRLVVGKPPLAITWEDPYYEAFGKHFAELIERHGAPVIVLNLLKQMEKRRFEQQLTDGFLKGIQYLNQFAPTLRLSNVGNVATPSIGYIDFDMAHIKRSHNILDRLKVIANQCVQHTGIFFSAGHTAPNISREEFIQRTKVQMGSNLSPRQQGIVRTNCVDCLDRTNTAQFVLGHVAMAHQFHAVGLLAQADLSFNSIISRLLQNLYEEHGDALALQYGGSGVVHSIETYQNPNISRVNSRDIMQTLSRYYSNNFVDFEKQLATDLFLRIFRPGAGPSPEGEWRHPEDASTVAAVVSARSGQAFLFSSEPAFEAHMHWLQAWAVLHPYRTALSTWFPKRAFITRQHELMEWCTCSTACATVVPDQVRKTTSCLSTHHARKYVTFLELGENDPGGDWFSELYQPYDWTHFYDLKYHQLPLVTNESISVTEKPFTSLSHLALMTSSCLAGATPMHEYDQSLFEIATVTDNKAMETAGRTEDCKQNLPSILMSSPAPMTVVPHTSTPLSFNNKDEVHDLDSTFAMVSNRLQGCSLAGARNTPSQQPLSLKDLTPADSGMSSLLARFACVWLSELDDRRRWVSDTSAEGSDTLIKENVAGDDCQKGFLEGLLTLCFNSSSIKFRQPSNEDMESYDNYASIPQVNIHPPMSDVLTVSHTSMKIYEDFLAPEFSSGVPVLEPWA